MPKIFDNGTRQFFRYLALMIFPLKLVAQAPVIHDMENYRIGNAGSFADVGIVPSAGPAGAAQIWDFSSLVLADTAYMQIVSAAGAPYPGVSYAQRNSSGVIQYLANSPSGTAIVATIDSTPKGGGLETAHVIKLNTGIIPITYLTDVHSTFSTLNADLGIQGGGYQEFIGDGYGTLKIPRAVFNNVLRIKAITTEVDSVAGFDIHVYDTTVSYIWYDDLHPTALMRIDSFHYTQIDTTDTIISSKQSAQYLLAYTTGLSKPVFSKVNKLVAVFNNQQLEIFGELETGSQYEMTLINMTGQVVAKQCFVANGFSDRFYITNSQPGVYLVQVCGNGVDYICKLAKQY